MFGGRLFETNGDIKTMFAKLKDYETVAELRSSKILEDHAMKVICTIDDAIVNLDDMEYVTRMLQTVAQSHSSRFPNFDPEFFSVGRVVPSIRVYSFRSTSIKARAVDNFFTAVGIACYSDGCICHDRIRPSVRK